MVASSSSTLTRSSTIYTLSQAVELHESVPPERWCITRADLKHLRQEVQEAIQKGEIRPPDDGKDDFETSDKVFGPSVYTVNTQYLMPVTDRVGKVSWALMMHPDGLDCHLFISHAWQEGIFEFISKVLHSWPSTALHAWCCMLANPQNLNIGALLEAPSSSPFALALQASSCVLVVPNRHCSIYTRPGGGTKLGGASSLLLFSKSPPPNNSGCGVCTKPTVPTKRARRSSSHAHPTDARS